MGTAKLGLLLIATLADGVPCIRAPIAEAHLAGPMYQVTVATVNKRAHASSNNAAQISALNDSAKVLAPGVGSKTRTAILDALRARLKTKGRFKVDYIRTYKTWAFVRATEVVELDRGELQETDLTVWALLELPANSSPAFWRIAEMWTLPDDDKHSMADFTRGVRAKQRAERLPAALFPNDLR